MKPVNQEPVRTLVDVMPPKSVLVSSILTIYQDCERFHCWHGKKYIMEEIGEYEISERAREYVRGLYKDANRTLSLKQAFEELDVRRTICASPDHYAKDPECPGYYNPPDSTTPKIYVALSDSQTIYLVNRANSLHNSTQWHKERVLPNGDIERSWFSFVIYRGFSYGMFVNSTWRHGMVNIREGVPANYVLTASLVQIRLAHDPEGRSEIRVNLTDSMLAPYPKIKEALIWVSAATRRCPAVGDFGPGCAPTADFRFNEEELSEFIQLTNSGLHYSRTYQGRIDKDGGSVIIYGSDRYLVYILTYWNIP